MMATDTTRTVLLIAGMRTIGCSEKVAAALGLITGVTKADVDFWNARAAVIHHSPCNTSQLIRAVQGAGYGASLAGTASDDGRWSGHGISSWGDEANPQA